MTSRQILIKLKKGKKIVMYAEIPQKSLEYVE